MEGPGRATPPAPAPVPNAMFDQNPSYRVASNVITGGGSFSLGIFANTPGVVIRKNHVTVDGVSTNGTYGIMVKATRVRREFAS